MEFQFRVIEQNIPLLIQGLYVTLQITAIALVIGIVLGGVFCSSARRRKWC